LRRELDNHLWSIWNATMPNANRTISAKTAVVGEIAEFWKIEVYRLCRWLRLRHFLFLEYG
jgi:hypothetical protein